MSDAETSAVPPPFDEVPAPDADKASGAKDASGTRFQAEGWRRLALLASFGVALGFGQSFALTMLFGEQPVQLSPKTIIVEKNTTALPEQEARVEAEVDAPPVPDRAPVAKPLHELAVARQRISMGDVEWARRTASAFLLRVDGLGQEDTRRSSEAYALLGDVLRHEYERSLPDRVKR